MSLICRALAGGIELATEPLGGVILPHYLTTPILHLPGSDPLYESLMMFENLIGVFSPTGSSGGSGDSSILGFKPAYMKLPSPDLQSYLQWGAYVTNVTALLKDFVFTRGDLICDHKDHSMRHLNIQGEVVGSERVRLRVCNDLGIYPGAVKSYIDHWSSSYVLTLDEVQWPTSGQPFGLLGARLRQIATSELGVSAYDRVTGVDGDGVYYSDLWVEPGVADDSVAAFGYTITRKCWTHPVWYHLLIQQVRWDFTPLRMRTDFQPGGSQASFSRDYDCLIEARVNTSFWGSQMWGYPDPSSTLVVLTSEQLHSLEPSFSRRESMIPLSSGAVGSQVEELVWGRTERSARRSFTRFGSEALDIMRDVYPIAFLAAKSAMENEEERLTQNNIEALSELSEVVDLIDLPEALAVLPRAIKGGKGKIEVMKALLSMLSDLKLVYSLGLAPTYSGATEIAAKAERLSRKWSQKGITQFQGKTVLVEVPSTLMPGFPGSKVLAKCVLDVNIPYDTLLFKFLTLDALGLLPRTATLWDLVPWSFVLDAFTGLGNSGDMLDKQIMLLAVKVIRTCVIYRVVYDFTPEDEAEFNFSVISTTGDPPRKSAGYRYIERVVTNTVPVLSPSRLPLITPGTGFNWSLHGALFYKLLS